MRLRDGVVESVKKAGVRVYFADRRQTKIWNGSRADNEPAFFGGWYWHRFKNGKVVQTDEEGPFRTESAALRDAFTKLQLRPLD
jgi:hypothetical protein